MKKPLRVVLLLKRAVPLVIVLTTMNMITQAQDCGCDFVIDPPADPTTSLFIDGDVLGVNPGQTICLTAGLYKQIRFIRISGEPGNPVTIKNCGGLVQIGDEVNYGRWYATDLVRCRYVRYTGSGDPAYKYGIKLGKSGDSGLKIGLSTNNEIDHLEIGHANFAGILAKTDYGGNPPPDAPEMNNLNIHDNYIHDARGEGMYLGETRSPGENIRHMEVWNNIITRSGRESIQVANVIEDIQVHHNVFYTSGTLNLLYQNKGFQIGDNSVGRYYNNFLIGSPSNTMIVMGSGNIEITNNYMADAGDPGFFIDNRPFTIPGSPIHIHKNYMMEVNEGFPFFNVYNEISPIAISENILEGNNVVASYGSGAGPNVTVSGNTFQTIERVQFTDVENDDFTLAPGSPYQDLGLMNDVSGRNNRPYIALIPDQALDFETTVNVVVSATDPDGDALTLEAFNLPHFVSFEDNGNGQGVFSVAPQAGDAGVYYKARVRVTDSKGSMNTEYFNITVLDPYAFIATASSSLINTHPDNTLDGDLSTRWAAGEGSGNWIQYDLREDKMVTSVQAAFFDGTASVYPVKIEISEDGNSWVEVLSDTSSGITADFETFAFDEVRARYLRIVDNGTVLNSYIEVVINCTTAPEQLAFFASDDLYVDGKKIIDDGTLKVKEPKATSYLRFEVNGLDTDSSPVVSATLKLTALQNGYGSLTVFLGDDTDWRENTADGSTLPRPVQILDTLITDLASGQGYELNVGSAVAANGVYNFVLVAENSRGGMVFSSAEGEFQPQLLIETLRGAEVETLEAPALYSELSQNNRSGKSGEIKLYPNPSAREKVTLDLGVSESDFVSVEISDKVGKPFFTRTWTDADQLLEIDISSLDLDSGMYFLKVKQDDRPLEVLRMFLR